METVLPPPDPEALSLEEVDLSSSGILVPAKVFDNLFETSILGNGDGGIISIMKTDDLLTTHSKPDEIRVGTQLCGQYLHNQNMKDGTKRTTLAYTTA